MERTGIIPPEGTSVIEQGWVFTVDATSGNRIDTVRVEPPAREAESGGAE
jgi:CBS domain containing-hemolysin-like protein